VEIDATHRGVVMRSGLPPTVRRALVPLQRPGYVNPLEDLDEPTQALAGPVPGFGYGPSGLQMWHM
jgi:hypothetical protein